MENLSEKVKSKIENGEYKEALELCEKALESEPANIELLHMALNTSNILKNYEKSRDFLEQLIIAEPLNPENYYDLGSAELLIFSNYDKAIAHLSKSYELDENNKHALYKIGYAHKMKKDYKTARDYYEKLIKETENKELLAHTYIELGFLSATEYDFYHSLKYLSKAEHSYPQLPDTYIVRAILYKDNIINYNKALKELRKALKYTKDDSIIYYLFADIYYLITDYKSALKYINKAIKINEYDCEYYFLRALIQTQLESRIAEILSDITTAIFLSEETDEYWAYRSEAFICTREYVKALDDINRAISINPEKARYYRVRGDIYYKTENYYDASVDYKKYIDLWKMNSEYEPDKELMKVYNDCLERMNTGKDVLISSLAGKPVCVN